MSSHIRELEERLPIISQQLEDVQAASLPPGQTPSLDIRKLILLDYGFTVRRYFNTAASIPQSTISAPSMQISSLESGGSSSVVNSSAFQTALTHIASDVESNNPSSKHTISVIKRIVKLEAGFHGEHYHLEYQGEIHGDDKWLGRYRSTRWRGALTMFRRRAHPRPSYDESLNSNYGSNSSIRSVVSSVWSWVVEAHRLDEDNL